MFSRIERCGSRACSRSAGTSTTPRRMTSKGCPALTTLPSISSWPRSAGGCRRGRRTAGPGPDLPGRPCRGPRPPPRPARRRRAGVPRRRSWLRGPAARRSRRRRRPDARLVTDDGRRLAQHRRHDLRLAALARHERRDVATVAQDRAHVAVLPHLRQTVGDEQHGTVPFLPPPHHVEHPLRQVGRERGGDLVEQQQLRDRTPAPGPGRACGGTAAARRAPARRDRARRDPSRRAGAHRADVDAGQAQVLGDGEVGRHRRVLEHRGQPVRLGVARTAQPVAGRAMAIVPASARRTPVRILTSVDLPAPLAPSRACTSPGRT